MTYETADVVGVKGTPMVDGIYEFVDYHEPGVCKVTNDFCGSEIFVLEERVNLICKRANRADIGDQDAS